MYYASPRVPDRIIRRVNRPGREAGQRASFRHGQPRRLWLQKCPERRLTASNPTVLAVLPCLPSGAVPPARASTMSPSCTPKACSHPTAYLTSRLRRQPASTQGATNTCPAGGPLVPQPPSPLGGLRRTLARSGGQPTGVKASVALMMTAARGARPFISESSCR